MSKAAAYESHADYCSASKAPTHSFSDYSYWASDDKDGRKKHPCCSRCGWVDTSRTLDSYLEGR
jgi:hypothetical protein